MGFSKNHQFSKNCSSLPLKRTHFVTEERHITDMSSIRKKILEPWEIVRETCGLATKIAMFTCFCPSKKPLFSLFLQILPFQAEIQKIKSKKGPQKVSANPIFCTQDLPNRWKKSTLKQAWRTESVLLLPETIKKAYLNNEKILFYTITVLFGKLPTPKVNRCLHIDIRYSTFDMEVTW